MKQIVLLAIFLLIIVGACQKESEILSSKNEEISDVTHDSTFSEPQLKISSSNILSATSPNHIPSQMFGVNSIYKTAYYHYKQPDASSCSWTSYVNCINCIVTANNNYCYPTPITTVRYRCQQYYPNVSQYGASHILALEWHAGKYDQGYMYYSRKSPTNRWDATKYMLAHINSYHTPFVVRSSMNGIGHYRVVFSIDWKQTESASTVYYTDCWYANAGSFNGNIRSMSLADFLNAMTVGASCYNMLLMWPK